MLRLGNVAGCPCLPLVEMLEVTQEIVLAIELDVFSVTSIVIAFAIDNSSFCD